MRSPQVQTHPHMPGRAYSAQTQTPCLRSRMGRERCSCASELLRHRPRPATSLRQQSRNHPTQIQGWTWGGQAEEGRAVTVHGRNWPGGHCLEGEGSLGLGQ